MPPRKGPQGGRPPFDPRKVRASAPTSGLFSTRTPDEAGLLTVSQLSRLVRSALNAAFPAEVRVLGEVSNLSQGGTGHLYFTLKDAGSEVRCAMWQSDAARLRFRPLDGMELIATGTIDVFEQRGQYQFYARRLEPRGVGILELAFRQLKDRLAKEGLFEPARKRPLPLFPRRIAIVTSLGGAVLHDILQTIQRRFPCVEVLVFGVRVQGEGAAEEIADAIRRVNHSSPQLGGIDVLIVGRGGGSLEDLWAFNEEVVARAIYASCIPVVSAVGHEVDFTIADFVADVRAATPTAAAELVVPLRSELFDTIREQQRRLSLAARRLLEAAGTRLGAIERCAGFRSPVETVRRRQQALDEIDARLRFSLAEFIRGRGVALHGLEVRILCVRPEAVLSRRRELLSRYEHRLRWVQGKLNLSAERRLRELAARLMQATPRRHVDRSVVLLDQWKARLSHAMGQTFRHRDHSLNDYAVRLSASSHEAILRRGFTITRLAHNRKLLQRREDAQPGERLVTELADGTIMSRVLDGRQGKLFD